MFKRSNQKPKEAMSQELFDYDILGEAASMGCSAFTKASPCPHVVFNSISNLSFVRVLAGECVEGPASTAGAVLQSTFMEVNSGSFIRFLEGVTGEKKLLPDPYFLDAGIMTSDASGELELPLGGLIHPTYNLRRKLTVVVSLAGENILSAFSLHLVGGLPQEIKFGGCLIIKNDTENRLFFDKLSGSSGAAGHFLMCHYYVKIS